MTNDQVVEAQNRLARGVDEKFAALIQQKKREIDARLQGEGVSDVFIRQVRVNDELAKMMPQLESLKPGLFGDAIRGDGYSQGATWQLPQRQDNKEAIRTAKMVNGLRETLGPGQRIDPAKFEEKFGQ